MLEPLPVEPLYWGGADTGTEAPFKEGDSSSLVRGL